MRDARPLRLPRGELSLPSLSRRLRQGIAALASRSDPEVDRRLRALVADERQWELLARLSSYDRAHHLAIYDALASAGCVDGDVLHAALLHDVGKADERGRVWLPHRVVKVLGERWAPGQLHHLAERDGGWLRHGVWLAVHHASAGADLAEAAGASARVCELIRRHEDAAWAAEDTGLALLRRIDERVTG